MDKNKFLANVTDWENHRPLLWLALEETMMGQVLELGCGGGSTPYLHEYCKEKNRELYSFDNSHEWIEQFKEYETGSHKFVQITNWNLVSLLWPSPTVILIDHAPGERRIVDVQRFKDIDGILVLHDTQPPPTQADYGWENIWPLFKYVVHLDAGKNPDPAIKDNRTWASAVSNTIDVTKWKGLIFNNGDYKLK